MARLQCALCLEVLLYVLSAKKRYVDLLVLAESIGMLLSYNDMATNDIMFWLWQLISYYCCNLIPLWSVHISNRSICQ